MSDDTVGIGSSGNLGSRSLTSLGSAAQRVDFWIFVAMLVLALIGAGVSQIEDTGGWLYWFGLVVVYAAISVSRAWFVAKDQGQPVWPMIRSQVFHWLGALVAIKIILLFEATGVTDRGPASVYSLLVLALACYLAGVHFNWSFMLLGVTLGVIAVALQYLDQLSVILVALPVAVLAVWIVFKRKFSKVHQPS